MAPLYDLLQSKTVWDWTERHEKAFADAKGALRESQVLAHFNSSLPVILFCDASPVGIGVVLVKVVDGMKRPVTFISRSLSYAERNYSQLERKVLAIIFAVVRLRQYLLGRFFYHCYGP